MAKMRADWRLTPRLLARPHGRCPRTALGGVPRRGGIAIGYLSLIVLVPLAALPWSSRA